MIVLGAQRVEFNAAARERGTSIVRVTTDMHRPMPLRKREAFFSAGGPIPDGYGWHLTIDGEGTEDVATAALSRDFVYLRDGDVTRLSPEQGAVRVLYRRNSANNSFLLTERCDNYCLMCSQPPRRVNDGWIVDEMLQTLPLIDPDTKEIGFTGGEPSLLGPQLVELISACKAYLPRTALHILSNGRGFADESFARQIAAIDHPNMMLGIPVYSDQSHLHDFVVQADGAFDETIRGILNLKRYGVGVELRVVLHRHTVPRLPQLAHFITRNLLFVDQVALMGLEIMGFARANLDDLWIDPAEYQHELREAVGILDRAKLRALVFNHPLCLIHPSVRPFAVRSISDWKQEYAPECESCSAMSECGGFFSSARYRRSPSIRPFIPNDDVSDNLAAGRFA